MGHLKPGLSLRAADRGFPAATFIGNKRKMEPKELPSWTIPLLLITYTLQLEILAKLYLNLINFLLQGKGQYFLAFKDLELHQKNLTVS